jgi:RimJ/RimL family protein N-acetyltransferase
MWERPEFPRFEGERVLLRALAPGDEAFLAGLDTDPEVMRYIGGPLEEEDAFRFAGVMVQGQEFRWRWGRWIVEDKASGERLGWMELFKLSLRHSDVLQLGYQFAPAHWGQGYASESLQLLIEYCFGPLEFPELHALIHPENERSRRLLAKFGFQKIGKRMDGHEILCDHLRLLKAE